MSTHPNVIIVLALTPDDLPNKTFKAILADTNTKQDDDGYCRDIKIGNTEYTPLLMDGSYYEGMQISGKDGDILFYDLVTYGYGDTIGWDKLLLCHNELEEWAKTACKKYECSSYRIYVTANYW